MAKSISALLVILTTFLFGACQSIEQISIDYMLPADISFPSELRKVAIVDNTSSTPDNKLFEEKGIPKNRTNNLSWATAYSNGDSRLTTETLAKEIANQNYFDEVIICDSALRANDRFTRENTLSQEETKQLTSELDVDALISLENIQLKATKTLEGFQGFGYYRAAVDVKVYPTIKVYLPNRITPMVTLNDNDSIFWEEYGGNELEALSRILPEKQMLKEASEFAGTVPVKQLVPYWETNMRYFYTSGSINMRDAAVYVRERLWDKAFKLWNEDYKKKKSDKKKMRLSLNIALYYEINDSIAEAEKWALNAQELAYKVDKVEEKVKVREEIFDMPNYLISSRYVLQLKERNDKLPKLNAQMQRFSNDF